jgi:hypothetical protein
VHLLVTKNFDMLYIIWVKTDCLRPPTQLNITFMGKSVPTYVVSINIAIIGTNYDVTMGDYCSAVWKWSTVLQKHLMEFLPPLQYPKLT